MAGFVRPDATKDDTEEFATPWAMANWGGAATSADGSGWVGLAVGGRNARGAGFFGGAGNRGAAAAKAAKVCLVRSCAVASAGGAESSTLGVEEGPRPGGGWNLRGLGICGAVALAMARKFGALMSVFNWNLGSGIQMNCLPGAARSAVTIC